MDYNSIYYKLVLRENKKRKTTGVTTSREESVQNEVDNEELWDNPMIDEEEEALAQQEDEPQPLPWMISQHK